MLFPSIHSNKSFWGKSKECPSKCEPLPHRSEKGVPSEDEVPANLRLPVAPFHVGTIFEVVPGRLSFAVHRNDEHTLSEIKRLPKIFFFSSDLQDRFEPFCADFGPVKLSVVYRFCTFVQTRMQDPRLAKRTLVYYCDDDKASCANTAFLLGCYAMLHENYTPEQAFAPFQRISPSPFPGFRDATYRPADYTISLLDCFRGLRAAMLQGWYEHKLFEVEEYEFWDDPDHGDFHEVTPKFIAFKGPTRVPTQYAPAFQSKTPEDFTAIFKEKGVSAVVRLNEKDTYDADQFTAHGIRHYDLFFEDCGVPNPALIARFLDICDKERGRIAVHCTAGLGRTGTMIALWMMKTLSWKADEAIAWLRIVRPGSVIGAQQHFLKMCERARWEGNKLILSRQLLAAACPVNARQDAWELARAMVERDLVRGGGRLSAASIVEFDNTG